MDKLTQDAILSHASDCEQALIFADKARQRGERQSAIWHSKNARHSSTLAFILAEHADAAGNLEPQQ